MGGKVVVEVLCGGFTLSKELELIAPPHPGDWVVDGDMSFLVDQVFISTQEVRVRVERRLSSTEAQEMEAEGWQKG